MKDKKRKHAAVTNKYDADEPHAKALKQTIEPMAFHQLTCNNYYKASAIRRVAFNKAQTLLAVARTTGDIEIWTTNGATVHSWVPIKRIPAQSQTTVEAIVWKFDKLDDTEKLYTAGLHGCITEWDLETLLPKNTSEVLGGAIWDMCTSDNSEYLAVACEDGKIRMYDTQFVLHKYFGPSRSDPIPTHKTRTNKFSNTNQ
jgi:U3 small nucleolar RNA-associated protein 4